MKIIELTEKQQKRWPDKAGVYPICYINNELHVYLMRPSDPKFGGRTPQMGKGGIDEGESPEQAALREGQEELGLKKSNIKNVSLLIAEDSPGMRDTYKLYVFVAEIDNPSDFDQPGYETGWCGWLPIDKAISKTRTNHKHYLQMLKSTPITESIDRRKVEATIQDKLQQADELQAGLANSENPNIKQIRTLRAEASYLQGKLDLSDQGIDSLDKTPDQYSSQDEWIEELKPAIANIKRDCQPYLKEIQNNLTQFKLFRGLTGTNDMTMTGRVRLGDRKSAGLSQSLHQKLNDYFEEAFGEPFRNSLFVSSDPDFAKDYGNLFIVFPIGEFSYLWSPDVRDLYNIEHYITDAIDDDEYAYQDGEEPEFFDTYMKSTNYQTTEFTKGVTSNNEIMIRCKAYHGINLTEFFDRNDYDDDSKGNADAINTAIQLIQGLL